MIWQRSLWISGCQIWFSSTLGTWPSLPPILVTKMPHMGNEENRKMDSSGEMGKNSCWQAWSKTSLMESCRLISPPQLYFIPKQQFHSQATFFTLRSPGSVLDLIKIQLLAIHPIPTNYFKGIPRSTKCRLAY